MMGARVIPKTDSFAVDYSRVTRVYIFIYFLALSIFSRIFSFLNPSFFFFISFLFTFQHDARSSTSVVDKKKKKLVQHAAGYVCRETRVHNFAVLSFFHLPFNFVIYPPNYLRYYFFIKLLFLIIFSFFLETLYSQF